MDKRIIIVLLLIIIAIIVTLIVNKNNDNPSTTSGDETIINNEVPPEEEKTVEVTEEIALKIKEEAYLNILLNIKNFDSFNVNNELLLEAAMRIAEKQGLYQSPEEGYYTEYVPRTTIHDIIYELSGIRVQDPIIIEDFFYAYKEDGDYYYVVPLGANWMELDEIHSITYTKSTDQYTVLCSAKEGTEDYGMVLNYPNMEIKLKYKSSNKYIKYQLVSIESGKSSYQFDE